VTERWQVAPRTKQDGSVEWRVHDAEDASRPVAAFATEEAAHAHVRRLQGGPFDLDEQDERERERDESWGEPDQRIPWEDDWGTGRGGRDQDPGQGS
jgi:hypothetical protein